LLVLSIPHNLLDIQAQMAMAGTASILDLHGVIDFGGYHGGGVY